MIFLEGVCKISVCCFEYLKSITFCFLLRQLPTLKTNQKLSSINNIYYLIDGQQIHANLISKYIGKKSKMDCLTLPKVMWWWVWVIWQIIKTFMLLHERWQTDTFLTFVSFSCFLVWFVLCFHTNKTLATPK